MLLHVVLLLVVQFVNQSITLTIPSLQEGDHCTLRNNRIGICRKYDDCRSNDLENVKFCDGKAVVCCDVIRQQCEDLKQAPSNPFAHHIVGIASEAEVGQFPFVALVEYDQENIRCGASIISRRFLLTAAHCYTNQATMLRVRLGMVNTTDSDATSIEIDTVLKHPDYNRRTKQNDIALIKLKEDIEISEDIKPICLYTEQENIPEGTNLTLLGWGTTNEDILSQFLHKQTLQPVLRSECQRRYSTLRRNIQISENQMCALGSVDEYGVAADACHGDDGGPLVLEQQDGNDQLVGVVSIAVSCGSELFAGVYTRVSKYLDWIVKQGVWN